MGVPRYLMVIGCQKTKLAAIGKKNADKLKTWIAAHQDEYDRIIAVNRCDLLKDNFNRMGDTIATNEVEQYEFRVDQVMEVPGYDIDCTKLPTNVEYYIVGISTAASVLCAALSMFSANCRIHILKDHCYDRMGLNKEAIKIMETYMPGSVQ